MDVGDTEPTSSAPDNIEGEDMPPGDDEEPEEDEEGKGEEEQDAFDPNTGSGGMTTGEGGDVAKNLAAAIQKHKEMMKRASKYMGSY